MKACLGFLIPLAFLAAASSNDEVYQGDLVDSAAIQNMEMVFDRSEEAHKASIDAISRHMTVPKAVEVLRRGDLNTPELMQAADIALAGSLHLRKHAKGYGGIDGARKLLNDMIFESMSKYDAEIAKCTEYYGIQCALMESCRGQIAASNYIAANSRALILDSQATINRCEVEIPAQNLNLKNHLLKCKHEVRSMNERLKIVLGDIAVMTMILEMTDCEKQMLQTKTVALLQCQDQCTEERFIKFNHEGLQLKVSQLQSVSHNLMRETFSDLFEGIENMESLEFLQSSAVQANKTQFNNPPVPKTKVPRNPCSDPYAGAPSATAKATAKCTIKKTPQCYTLQERFLFIQAGIQDERDDIMSQVSSLERLCEETQKTYDTQIQDDKATHSSAQTKLAIATEKEATAGETARETAAEHDQLTTDLNKQMTTCSQNYVSFETEMCALKKIRGELYKMKSSSHSAFFQDCELSKWDPEECSKKCAKGQQRLTRSVLTHPNGGAKCLPLAAVKSCNLQPCPVNCRLLQWSGWSKCSAECGGGVQQRIREVKVGMKHAGKPCGATSEAISCNPQACEQDCVLSRWTKWSRCSKDCDGGTAKRQKFVLKPAQGAGKCSGEWSLERLQYKTCAMNRCRVPAAGMPLGCNRSLDVVLLLDGSGSLGLKGWNAELQAAQYFVDAFIVDGFTQANMAVILYSGPRTWSGVSKCTGKSRKKVSPKICGIRTVTHFTQDLNTIKQLIRGLKFPKGSTLTSLALMTARSELSLGRKHSPSNVIVFTGGRPLSYRKTGIAANEVRKSARLLWVPVTNHAPLKEIKEWATRRWQENVVHVTSFAELGKPDVITHIVANICPSKSPKIKFAPKSAEEEYDSLFR